LAAGLAAGAAAGEAAAGATAGEATAGAAAGEATAGAAAGEAAAGAAAGDAATGAAGLGASVGFGAAVGLDAAELQALTSSTAVPSTARRRERPNDMAVVPLLGCMLVDEWPGTKYPRKAKHCQ
jgi:hypothetical protein